MSSSETVFIAALIIKAGGRVELTDMDLALADSGGVVTVWRNPATRITTITAYDQYADIQDLGEATIEPDEPAAIEPRKHDMEYADEGNWPTPQDRRPRRDHG